MEFSREQMFNLKIYQEPKLDLDAKFERQAVGINKPLYCEFTTPYCEQDYVGQTIDIILVNTIIQGEVLFQVKDGPYSCWKLKLKL